METNKKAISLIVLVITIIVLAILAATVIISLSNTNIIEQARNTAFKSDMANYKEAYNLYLTSMYAKNPNYDKTELTEDDLATIFNENDYPDELTIVDGELVYETTDTEKQNILTELGIAYSTDGAGSDETLEPSPEEWFTSCTIPDTDELDYVYSSVNLQKNWIDATSFIGKSCFDEESGVIYSVNMPEGETVLVIPETINGVTVTGVSGFSTTNGDSGITIMPSTLTKVVLPAGITLYSGAFAGTNGGSENIELVTNGPVRLDLVNGPTINTSSPVEISYLKSAYYGLFVSGITNFTFTEDFTGENDGLPGEVINVFETEDGVFDIPRGFDVVDIVLYDELTGPIVSGTIYMTQSQFDSSWLEYFGSATSVGDNKYRIYEYDYDTDSSVATDAYVQIRE